MRTSLAFLYLLFTASPVLAQKEYGFDNTKPSGQPYLKPEESLARLKVPDEFEVKLFAAEPLVVNPVAFTIDEKGRIWVVECFDYPKRAGKNAPRDRIVILEDTKGTGVCDKRTVFAEGKDFPIPEERKKAGLGAFDLCTGIEVGHGGVFVGAAPYLWFIENKDDKPGKFEVLLKGFGSQDTHETLNTFQWGPDGWLYGLQGVFTQSNVKPLDGPETRMNAAVWRYHPTLKKFEIFAEGTSNPWGMDWRNTDGQFILCCCVIPHLYHIVPGGIYKRQAGASYNPYAYGYLNEICDHTFHKESGWAHAGLISLDAPHIPEKYRNSVIFGSIHGCSIKQNILKPNGSTYTATRGDDFLQSGDKNFRPINLRWGPLGDIYVIDWHDQNPCHQAGADSWDYEHGRVYRIQLKGTKAKKAEDLGKKTDGELAKIVLEDENPCRVRQSLLLLDHRTGQIGDTPPQFPEALFKVAQTALASKQPVQQVRAKLLMTSIHVYLQEPELAHNNPLVRAIAARELDLTVIAGPPGVQEKENEKATKLATKEANPAVRRELASAAIRNVNQPYVTSLVHGLMSHKEDAKDPVIPQLVWIAYERIISRKEGGDTTLEIELSWLTEQSPENPFVREQIVPKVMRRLVATGKADDLKLCIDFITKLKDNPSREKAMDGLVIALAGQTVNAPDGWTNLQAEISKGGDARLIALSNKLAVNFRDPAALKRAITNAKNDDLPPDTRAEAVRQLGALKATETVTLLINLVRNDKVDLVRAEAARALSAFDIPKIPSELLASWKDYSKELRSEVVNALSTRREWARALLQAMAAKTVERTDVTDNVIIRIQAFNDGELNKLIEKAWGRTRPTPADLNALIDKTRDSLYAAPASFARGKIVFENNCAKCHKFDGKGAEVGPPLEGAARDIEYILVNVLDPNRVVGAPYFIRTARLLDDTVFQGVLAEEDDKTITLKLENNVLKKIKKEDLNGPVKVSEKSLMPEGLGYNMTAQDFRDLVRYLMAHPFIADAMVNGDKLAAGVPGRLLLPDTKGSPAVVEAEVTATGDMKTRLLIGSSADYEVRLDGKSIGTGKGTGKQLQPDQTGFDVSLTTGKHTLTIAVKGGAGNALHARFLDPDRKLRYPDPGVKP
jgi:putative membrane-bound dehydrogenase-like protein